MPKNIAIVGEENVLANFASRWLHNTGGIKPDMYGSDKIIQYNEEDVKFNVYPGIFNETDSRIVSKVHDFRGVGNCIFLANSNSDYQPGDDKENDVGQKERIVNKFVAQYNDAERRLSLGSNKKIGCSCIFCVVYDNGQNKPHDDLLKEIEEEVSNKLKNTLPAGTKIKITSCSTRSIESFYDIDKAVCEQATGRSVAEFENIKKVKRELLINALKDYVGAGSIKGLLYNHTRTFSNEVNGVLAKLNKNIIDVDGAIDELKECVRNNSNPKDYESEGAFSKTLKQINSDFIKIDSKMKTGPFDETLLFKPNTESKTGPESKPGRK